MKIRRPFLILLLLALVGCSPSPSFTPTASPTITPTASPGEVNVRVTSVPDPKSAASAYLDAWKAEDYPAMYALLTNVSQAAITQEDFVQHYQGVFTEAALSGLDYELRGSFVADPDSAQVSFSTVLHSVLVGDVAADTIMNLSLEGGQWKIQWDDTLVHPQLAGGNYMAMDPFIPARANIYDRNGHALVAQADATAIGLVPDEILPEQEEQLFSELFRLTGLREDTIRARYANWPVGSFWYLPLAEVPADQVAGRFGVLSSLAGLRLSPYKSRYYFEGGIAPHVVGYVSAIQAEEVDKWKRLGYRQDERVGREGLEEWGEQYLSGQRGGGLYIFNSDGVQVTRLAERPAAPSQAIYTTLDRDLQLGAQEAIAGFKGAVVAIEMNTGRVLAMASSPGFDPNAFDPNNVNYAGLLEDLYSNTDQPLYNRATQGQYPLGSAFKIVTMAAALEKGGYTAGSVYECGYFFEELSGVTLQDWTYEHFQEDGKTMPSGTLDLIGALIRSCNPWFWHIGLDLFNRELTTAVSDMARAFGLGSPTGIEGVREQTGQVPDPGSPLDATNLAIGQGDLQVTPLQVAKFVAAVGNGGTLYRPQLIEKIAPPDGDPSFTFKPDEVGKLPLSRENLAIIQEAMRGVVSSAKPRGTAVHRFSGMTINVAGKTGTAESGSGDPHAWFVGYSAEGRQDKPDIAVAVIVENVGEGSDYAAPIFRRIISQYFTGTQGPLYPWESAYGVTATPTSEFQETETPAPEEEEEEEGLEVSDP
jgi:penicillin-binding protein 2